MAVLVLSGPENFAKREKLRRSLVVPGRLVILMPGKIVKDVYKYSILSGKVAITFCNSYGRQICQRSAKIKHFAFFLNI